MVDDTLGSGFIDSQSIQLGVSPMQFISVPCIQVSVRLNSGSTISFITNWGSTDIDSAASQVDSIFIYSPTRLTSAISGCIDVLWIEKWK